jgi:hypothetical protein
MKPPFIVLASYLLFLSLHRQHDKIALAKSFTYELRSKGINGDSSNPIRIINTSSLKRLPAVIIDFSAAFNGSAFQNRFLLDKKGFAVYLYDVTCNSLECSAAVRYQANDTLYHLKLNRYYQQAADKALAATLIHEIMHCVLLDIYTRAKQGDKTACDKILSFGLNKNDSSNFFNNEFFVLMNSGETGNHELMYQLFYPYMVSLLERFAVIHKLVFSEQDAQRLMWSGLQKTIAYTKLSDKEKKDIDLAILKAKGIDIAEE